MGQECNQRARRGDTTVALPDQDGDGIPDIIEQFAPAPYNAVAPGLNSIAAYPLDNGGYGELLVVGGNQSDVTPIDDPDSAGHPAGTSPAGVVSFTVHVAEPGGTVSVGLAPGAPGVGWWKYGTPAQGKQTRWYNLPESSANVVDVLGGDFQRFTTVDLVDGDIGDDNHLANGVVVDPSGLYTAPAATGPGTHHGSDGGGGADGGGSLPNTGAGDPGPLIVVAVGTLWLGVALVIVSSRRRRRSRS